LIDWRVINIVGAKVFCLFCPPSWLVTFFKRLLVFRPLRSISNLLRLSCIRVGNGIAFQRRTQAICKHHEAKNIVETSTTPVYLVLPSTRSTRRHQHALTKKLAEASFSKIFRRMI
jgi:hypothetical protein